ncbi:hypothetical protein H0H87_004743 [Tephrocybe sp. NHM501043]|nr:hypothetical protein H0H87_004743 [Tephrocybe sp. NHM501043]
MHPSSDIDTLETYTSSPALSPLPYQFLATSSNESRLSLSKKGTSYAVLTALITDLGVSTPSVLGSVKLTLEDAQTIDSIIVLLKGQIVTRANTTKHFTFIDISKTVWSKDNDSAHRNVGDKQKYLYGDHFWPFTISLPTELVLPGGPKYTPEVYRLPESFHERHVRASVQYSLHLRLIRGKFRPDKKTQITLTYPPVAGLELFPFRRQSFCGTPFLVREPNEDIEAWYTHRGVVMPGRLSSEHIIVVKYTLSLIKPVRYPDV